MTGGVEEHTERGAGLVLGQRRAEFVHGLFSSIEIVDHDIDVHLLRNVLAGHCGGRNSATRWKQMHWSPAALRTSPQPSSKVTFQSSKAP